MTPHGFTEDRLVERPALEVLESLVESGRPDELLRGLVARFVRGLLVLGSQADLRRFHRLGPLRVTCRLLWSPARWSGPAA